MSINLYAVFRDLNDKEVYELPLIQTPTDVTFMCCGKEGDAPISCIDRYIKWYSGLEYAEKDHIDKIKNDIVDWSNNYTLDVYWL